MSLYAMQKFFFHLNREARVQQRYKDDRAALLAEYSLDDEEREAIQSGDIGKLYVLGCNGQALGPIFGTLGQVIGTLKLSLDGQPYGEHPVLALEAVPQAGIFGRMIDTIQLWFN